MIIEPKSKFGLELHFQLKVAQKLINRASYAAFCVEENAQFLYVNDATCSLLGYSQKEILSMTLSELDTNWEEEKWHKQWELLKQQGSINFKTWYRKKTGKVLPVEITFILEELEGNLICCGYACDQSNELPESQLQKPPKKSPNMQNGLELKIFEYQKTDDELRTSLSLLNSTLDSTANGILAINFEGEILYYNQKFIDIWHLPADVRISRNCRKAKAFFESQVKDVEVFRSQIWEFPAESDSETYIFLELKDGRILAHYSEPYRFNDNIIGR
ncbi:MAG: PAS domain S-box protein, partial [Cyanobacteria bacterium P01_D01_bin.50]